MTTERDKNAVAAISTTFSRTNQVNPAMQARRAPVPQRGAVKAIPALAPVVTPKPIVAVPEPPKKQQPLPTLTAAAKPAPAFNMLPEPDSSYLAKLAAAALAKSQTTSTTTPPRPVSATVVSDSEIKSFKAPPACVVIAPVQPKEAPALVLPNVGIKPTTPPPKEEPKVQLQPMSSRTFQPHDLLIVTHDESIIHGRPAKDDYAEVMLQAPKPGLRTMTFKNVGNGVIVLKSENLSETLFGNQSIVCKAIENDRWMFS